MPQDNFKKDRAFNQQSQNSEGKLKDSGSTNSATGGNELRMPPKAYGPSPEPILDPLEGAKLQAEAVNNKNIEELKKEAEEIKQIRAKMSQRGSFVDEEGRAGLERQMANLGMAGIDSRVRARELIGLREEAINEKRNMEKRGQDWIQLPKEEQDEIADRINWGRTYQNYWGIIMDRCNDRGISFKQAPVTEEERKSQKELVSMIGNEIELALSRNPKTRSKAQDNVFVDDLAEKIAINPSFLSVVNQEAKGNQNYRLIRSDIERLVNENLGQEEKPQSTSP